jgi:hypothetical protein
MSLYTLRFEWPADAAGPEAVRELIGATLDHAKLQSAMIYAALSFEDPAPVGYRIVQAGTVEVYRYPEPPAFVRAAE